MDIALNIIIIVSTIAMTMTSYEAYEFEVDVGNEILARIALFCMFCSSVLAGGFGGILLTRLFL